MVEQPAVNRQAVGSSPTLGANSNSTHSEAGSSEELAEVVELADTRDLKSRDPYRSYRFDPGLRHQFQFNIAGWSSWQLVGLITRRPQVRILSPQPWIQPWNFNHSKVFYCVSINGNLQLPVIDKMALLKMLGWRILQGFQSLFHFLKKRCFHRLLREYPTDRLLQNMFILFDRFYGHQGTKR